MDKDLLKKCNDALKSVILALDECAYGPAVNILPWHQLDKVLKIIEEVDDKLDQLSYNKAKDDKGEIT